MELVEQARLANDALAEQAGEASSLPAYSCGLTWLVRRRASSTPAILRRSGCAPGRSSAFVWKADRPFGLLPGAGYRVQALPLEVGDRLMFVTDGMLERDAARMNIAAILTEARTCIRARR